MNEPPSPVCLARVGKHCYWPALIKGGDETIVNLIFFGDNKTGCRRRSWLRPYSDLASLPATARGRGITYTNAISAANAWLSQYPASVQALDEQGDAIGEKAAEQEDAEGPWSGPWSINGEHVPKAALARAGKLLPSINRPCCPAPTFRLLPLPGKSDHLLFNTEEECSVDYSSDAAFERMHAPFEQLERDGFFAHPAVGEHVPFKHGGAESQQGDVIGRWIGVPAYYFQPGSLRMYEAQIIRTFKEKRCQMVDVYFPHDHTTCLFTKQQVDSWSMLRPDEQQHVAATPSTKKRQKLHRTTIWRRQQKELKETTSQAIGPTRMLDAEPDNWVSCDQCSKWRKLPAGTPVPGPTERWTCSMNTDLNGSSCQMPEEG